MDRKEFIKKVRKLRVPNFLFNFGLEAYANVPESVNGRTGGVSVTALDNSGKEWNFYIRNNKLITMYPSV